MREEDFPKTRENLLRYLSETVGDKECEFYLGEHGRFDYFAMKCCREYADAHPKCKLILVIPYLNRKYNQKDYDETVYPPLETVPLRLAIVRRNEWMIDKADAVVFYVAYIGYARKFLFYARKKKKKLINLAGGDL